MKKIIVDNKPKKIDFDNDKANLELLCKIYLEALYKAIKREKE